MKKMFVILVMVALMAGTSAAENTSEWKDVRAATASEATISINDLGGMYEVTIAVANTPGIYGIAGFAAELVGATTITNTAPMADFIDPANNYQLAPAAGFTLYRSADGEALVAASLDTVNILAPDSHRVYGFGQVAGDLSIYANPSFIMNVSVQPMYGAPLKVAEGFGLPTLDENRVMIFVPEPATLSLLAIGGLAILRWRSRFGG